MKNVLWITGTWPPARFSIGRQYKLAKYLPEYGWNPIVLAYGNSNFDPWVDNTPLKELEHLEVHRTKAGDSKILQLTLPFYLRKLGIDTNWWSAPDSQIRWKGPAIKEARRLIRGKKIDAIFSTVPPFTCHLVGQELSQITGIPWIADYRDFWSIQDIAYRVTTEQDKVMELSVLQSADWVTIVNQAAIDKMRDAFPFITDKSSAIMHGYDPEDYEGLDKAVKGNICHMTYAGTVYSTRIKEMKTFLQALAVFYEENPIARLKVGFVGNCKAIETTALDLGLCNGRVSFIPWLPRQRALETMARSDVLLLITGNSPVDKYGSPGKLFDYLGIGKSILAIVPEGEITRILGEVGGVVVAKPGDIEGITQAIEIVSKVESVERAGVEQYDIRNKAQEMAGVLDWITTS